MISLRGPHNILVSDRTVVPVIDLVAGTIHTESVSDLLLKYPVTVDEYFEAIDTFIDTCGPNDMDFIEIECIADENGDVSVDTAGISDWVYITCIAFGHDIEPTVEVFTDLYILGIESIMLDCLEDVKTGNAYYEDSTVHKLVYDAFIRSYGTIGPEVDTLIESLREHSYLEELKGKKDD